MKIVSIACLILAVGWVIVSHVASYWLGYYETEQTFDAADLMFGLMIETVLFIILITLGLSSLFIKRNRLWLLCVLVGFWPLVLTAESLMIYVAEPGGAAIVRGLHDRVMHDYTLDDLRRFAKEVNEADLIKKDWINHGDVSSLTDQQKAVVVSLKNRYSFMLWMDNGRFLHGPSILNYGDSNVVDFEWGGALSGHWGCSISVNGSKNDPNPDMFKTLPVSDDIYFYFE